MMIILPPVISTKSSSPMEASHREQSFHVVTSLIFPCPITQIYSVINNKVLVSSSGRWLIAMIVVYYYRKGSLWDLTDQQLKKRWSVPCTAHFWSFVEILFPCYRITPFKPFAYVYEYVLGSFYSSRPKHNFDENTRSREFIRIIKSSNYNAICRHVFSL